MVNSKSSSWNIVERLCFPAPKASYTIKSFPEELILIPREDGEKVPCLFLPFRHARFLFIYFHANAEDLGLCYSFCTIIRDLFQVHVLVVEYPGYGICPGHCDEEGIMLNATAAVRFALDSLSWPCDGIKLFGRSIGTGPAMKLAAMYSMAGLILVSPFLSIQRIFRAQVGPLAGLISDRFDNSQLASEIDSPTLIIHGQQDTLIPLGHSKIIYDALTSKKMMVCPAAMGHNTSLLASVGTFVLPMTQFFSLPDYTFEDIEVPAWAFPDTTADDSSSAAKEEEANEYPWLCASTPRFGGSTPQKVSTEWRRGGQPAAAGIGASVGFPLAMPVAQPAASVNQLQNSSATTSGSAVHNHLDGTRSDPQLQASRGYGFRSPPDTPRGSDAMAPTLPRGPSSSSRALQPPTLQGDPQVVEDCFLEPKPPETPPGDTNLGAKVQADGNVSISTDMRDAIDSGITWLASPRKREGDPGKPDKDEASESDSAAGPGTLRGAPELRDRMVERLREPEPEDELMPAKASEEQKSGSEVIKEGSKTGKALGADDSAAGLTQPAEGPRDNSELPKYCL